jgi:hypothetical protein
MQAVPEVESAFVEGPPWRLHVVVKPAPGVRERVEEGIAEVLAAQGIPAAEAHLEVSFLDVPEPRRRVRFVSSELTHPRVGLTVARAVVEWGGIERKGEARGESNPTSDLRLAAVATVQAVQQVVPAAPPFHVVGIKAVRVFDRDLVVVLVRVEGTVERPLVGTSLVQESPERSAGLAVLNALNRYLGNYLIVSD